MENRKQMSEQYIIGILLAVVGGFLDAYTYICRGHVFANAQTGNMVLLGLRIIEGKWIESIQYFIPILSFFFGILVAEIIREKYKDNANFHWRQIVIILEIIILVIVAFLPLQKYDKMANVLVSFVCSLQVESFRKVNGQAFATTMCTGNLRSATEQLYIYGKTHEKNHLYTCVQYYGIIFAFIGGAIIGGFFSNRFEAKAVLFGLIGLGTVLVLMGIKKTDR